MNDRQQPPRQAWYAKAWSSALLLTGALVATGIASACIAYQSSGSVGIAAVAVAAAIAWVGAVIAISMTARAGSGVESLHWLLGAMIFRFGLPLVAGAMLIRQGGPLAEAGVFGWIVVHYLVALAVETPLAVRLVQRASHVMGGA